MPTPLDCRLLEVDFAGIEAILTAYVLGDPAAMRLARLGIHAAVTALAVGKPADLSQSDADLLAYFKAIKHDYPQDYDRCKRVVHGNNYGLTPYGMVEQFPDAFPTRADAERVQRYYYALIPGLPAFHHQIRKQARERGFLGGPGPGGHPFGYRHWFWDVLSYQPTDEVTARRWLRDPQLKSRIIYLHGRAFKIIWGADAKRCIAFLPQSIAAGILKRAELRLFHPESADYIGDAYFGRTPLLHPIHDSLLLLVPVAVFDHILTTVLQVMQEPIPQLPCPPAWGCGTHLRIGVSARASAPGGNWAPFLSEADAAAQSEHEHRLIRPNLRGMRDLDVPRLDLTVPEPEAPSLPTSGVENDSELELWESLQRIC